LGAQALEQKIQSFKLNNVRLIWGDMSADQIVNLYQSCDIFVLPSRAEGWGLPLIEAAASGMPIITTNHSGHMEFLQHASSSVMTPDHVMVDINCPEYCQYYPSSSNYWGQWARPDVYAISSIMQAMCREYHHGLYSAAQSNSTIIRNAFDWSRSADRAACLLKEFL
jgi:glycosyltransferase involved in cell wall biosynthesis